MSFLVIFLIVMVLLVVNVGFAELRLPCVKLISAEAELMFARWAKFKVNFLAKLGNFPYQ